MNQSSPAIRGISAETIIQIKKYVLDNARARLKGVGGSQEEKAKASLQVIQSIFSQLKIELLPEVKNNLISEIMEELSGLGKLQPLIDDPSVSEIMVNGRNHVYVEQKGKVFLSDITFENDEEILKLIKRIITPLGRIIDADNPMVDARLMDGSRVNAVIPPVAIDGPSITIRKFSKHKLSIQDLIGYGTLTQPMADFIQACVLTKLNIVISGGTGTGKTTLLNVLSSYIPADERIVTIEDAAELALQQEHIVRMETKPATTQGGSSVHIRDLVRNSLRMRPDRIVVGEVRGGEAMDMLQAMNTGHDGSMTTLHANSPRDALSRMETMCLMSGLDLPLKAIRQQIASAIDLIIQISREKDGSRKVTAVTEVAGMEGELVVLTDVFIFERTGISPEGKVLGALKPTGIRPLFSSRLEASGYKLRPEVFGASISDILSSHRGR